MNFLLYDTETTGLPLYKEPSKHPDQPRVVSIGGILTDAHGVELERMFEIIKPDGWEIPEETVKIHGITMERAMDVGIPADEAIHRFLTLQSRASARVGFNEPFDARILRIDLYRHARGLDEVYGHGIGEWPYDEAGDADALREAVSDWWNYGIPGYDVMTSIQKVMGVRKWPKLTEAYYWAFEREMPNAHSAIDDAHHTRELFQWMLDHGHANLDANWFAGKTEYKANKLREKQAARESYTDRC